MIAAGLCLMGGCFAQDESSQVVETYWPAHSVRVNGRDVVIKPDTDGDLTTPIWREEGLYIEAKVENLSWTAGGIIMSFGVWKGGGQANDALYMATAHDGHIGPQAFSLGRSLNSGLRRLIVDVPYPVDYMHVVAHNLDFSLDVPGHYLTARAELGTDKTSTFSINLRGANNAFDFVVSGWCDDVRGMYYMNQPLLSVSHAEAVFTHGFNILTEL